MQTKARNLFEQEFNGIMFPRPPGMSDRNYDIVNAHLVLGKSLEDVSWSYGVTRERIRQIVENSLRRAIDVRNNPDQRRRFRSGLKQPVVHRPHNDSTGLRSISPIS